MLDFTFNFNIRNMNKLSNKQLITLITFIFSVVAFFIVWQYFQKKHCDDCLVASELYNKLSINVKDVTFNPNLIIQQAEGLVNNYSQSIYSDLAHLEIAKQYVLQNNLIDAVLHLALIIKHSKNINLQSISALRMARIYITMGDLDLAMLTLNQICTSSYILSKDILFGYIYLSKKNMINACQCWESVIQQISGDQTFKYDGISSILFEDLNTINI